MRGVLFIKIQISLLLSFALLSGTPVCGMASEGAKSLAKPSPSQYDWHEQERIMFVCLDPAAWQGREYDDHSTPLDQINPRKLDTDQWCRAAGLWGAKQILFVAKHTGGFCWWQTHTSKYGIKETPWKNGRGDVLAELAESCRKHGLNLGVYVYSGDDQWGAPMGSGGRTKDPGKQEAYNQIYRRQMTEVLSRYGRINEVWFDGGCVIDVSDILKKYARDAMVFGGPQATIRWPGTESGILQYPAWSSFNSHSGQGDPDGDRWFPLEADTPLYDHNWFWLPANEKKRKSLDQLMNIYYKSVGHGGVLLLNSTPNTEGLIPEDDMKAYEAFGREIDRRFARPLAETAGKGATVELELPAAAAINHAILMEDYREGERIREYVLEGLADGQWKLLAEGTAVGRMKIDAFSSTLVSKVRIRATRAAAEPLIRRLAVFQVLGPVPGEQAADRAKMDWRRCGSWNAKTIAAGATLNINLTPYITAPGQYEVKFDKTGGKDDFKIEKIELLFEGELANPTLLRKLAEPNCFIVVRAAQITKETSSAIRVRLSVDSGTTVRV